jgi:hypothetical protein
LIQSFFARADKSMPWGVGIAIALLIGCGQPARVCYPVRGQVRLKGKPLADATVVLHRADVDIEGNLKPIATTNSEGVFNVSTMRASDGAPPGDYAITVEVRALRKVGEEIVRDGPNQLPAKYARPETSGLRCTVAAGENELPPINLELH